jgi:hypothetical protein
VISLKDADRRTLLRTYLNDHMAGAAAGLSLARRAAASNRGTPLGDHLEELADEIEQDARELRELINRLGMPVARPKMLAAAVAERLGRLKLNGQVIGYSPLSRLVELEGLCGGIEVKHRLWESLKTLGESEPAIAGLDLERLSSRAEAQRDGLEPHRLEAARMAFGD